jgi:hypothetical protein
MYLVERLDLLHALLRRSLNHLHHPLHRIIKPGDWVQSAESGQSVQVSKVCGSGFMVVCSPRLSRLRILRQFGQFTGAAKVESAVDQPRRVHISVDVGSTPVNGNCASKHLRHQ